jgi:hypothetical protein
MTDIDLFTALRAECVKRGMSEKDFLVQTVDRRILELSQKYNEPSPSSVTPLQIHRQR